ncbi:MAG: hypothetical protein ACI8RZ_007700 [Myxococcota bacterium]|jgi:hypothetical protein
MLLLTLLLAASGQDGPFTLPQPELAPLVVHADLIAIVKVLATSNIPASGGTYTAATFEVVETLRGRAPATIEARTSIAFEGDPGMTKLGLVPGYKLVVFLDSSYAILDGGVFYLEAGFGWRPKRAGLFINPRSDHDWISEIDPSEDYTLWTLAEIRLAAESPRAYRRKQRREQDE